jgi:hypothetical protein
MKRIFRVEVDGPDDEVSKITLDYVSNYLEYFIDPIEGVELKIVELRHAQPAPVVNLGPKAERENTPTGDPRICGTDKLLELVRMDPMCGPYKSKPDFDPEGRHILVMVLPMVNVEASHEIMVHRVEVMAKIRDQREPLIFMLEIPNTHWKKLRKP